jgi:hypothetical protein
MLTKSKTTEALIIASRILNQSIISTKEVISAANRVGQVCINQSTHQKAKSVNALKSINRLNDERNYELTFLIKK